MNIRNILTTALISAVFAVSASTLSADNLSAKAQDNSIGLISKCMLSCSGNSGMLDIYAKTQSTMVMDSIGFNDLVLQKSSDGNNWSDELSLGSDIQSELRYYTYSAHVQVDGGYFYRVTCIHYAEGAPYRSNVTLVQTAENTSKAFWMEEYQNSHGYPDTTTTVPDVSAKETETTTTTTAVSVYTVTELPANPTASGRPYKPVSDVTKAVITADGQKNTAAETKTNAVTTTASKATTDVSGKGVTTSTSASASSKEAGSPITGASAPVAATIAVTVSAAVALGTKKK